MKLANAQGNGDGIGLSLKIVDQQQQAVPNASVELLKTDKNILVKAAISNAAGLATFTQVSVGTYYCKISCAGYQSFTTGNYQLPSQQTIVITLQLNTALLKEVSVIAKKPFIQHVQGKVIVNVDASVTNAGTTVLEVLEKSPGIMVDKNGTITMQAKNGVLVLIDDKQTYLSGAELANLLGSMSSSQIESIELMANPPAKYDASGNAGIINIKTKKNKQKGFNGAFTISAGQGKYQKNNNNLVMNYRNGKFNAFLNYSLNVNGYFTDIYALRNYYNSNGTIIAKLEQPTYFSGTSTGNTLKFGADYYLSNTTTVGISVTGVASSRKGKGEASATWLNAAGVVDSAITTSSTSGNRFRNGAVNLNAKHNINKSQDISVDVDWLGYNINNEQFFDNRLQRTNGYSNSTEGDIPSEINIFSAKADHTWRIDKNSKLESGLKTSHIKTDNLAAYQVFDGSMWQPDYGKSNHFLYTENIQALYSSFESKQGRLSAQAGVRYERTHYDANQLGNPQRKDSAFAKNYNGLFPSGYLSYEVDSSNTFTVTAGRRIDRPAFQKLNPFVTIINKYTYQRGNPFFLPQYSWNMELSHQYKQFLTTAVTYSITKNYFSQLFLNEGGDILTYTEGNVGKAHNLGISLSIQCNPFDWWSLNGQTIFNYKELVGFTGSNYASSIKQLNFNMNNQFRIGKNYTAELSGFYTTRARNDLQELLYPTGQLSVGVSRPVLKKKGTLKFGARDIFFTQVMEGLTDFDKANEYFILHRDTRVFTIALTYRFGKPLKTTKRSSSGANDEMQRVGNG